MNAIQWVLMIFVILRRYIIKILPIPHPSFPKYDLLSLIANIIHNPDQLVL